MNGVHIVIKPHLLRRYRASKLLPPPPFYRPVERCLVVVKCDLIRETSYSEYLLTRFFSMSYSKSCYSLAMIQSRGLISDSTTCPVVDTLYCHLVVI